MNEFLSLVYNFFESIGTDEHAQYSVELSDAWHKSETLLISVEILNQRVDMQTLFIALLVIRDSVIRRCCEKELTKSILLKLASLIRNFETCDNPCVSKAILCAADIVALNFEMLDVIECFPILEKCSFFILLIEELDDIYVQMSLSVETVTKIQNAILPIVIDLLRTIDVSDLFFRLLKRAFNCAPYFYPFSDFLPVIEDSLQVPQYHLLILEIVQTFLQTNPVTPNHPDCLFCEHIFMISITLSRIFALNSEYENCCDLWMDIIGYSPEKLLECNDSVLLQQFFQIAELLPQSLPKYHDVLYEICCLLSAFSQDNSQFLEEKFFILNILIRILDTIYSEQLINATNEIILSLGDLIFKFLDESPLLESLTPGILITIIQIPIIPIPITPTLFEYVSNNYPSIPHEHVLHFITHYGINYPDFKTHCLTILLNTLPRAEWQCVRALCALLQKHNDLIPSVPSDLIQQVILSIDGLSPSDLSTSLQFLQLFFSALPPSLFSRYSERVLCIARDSVLSNDERAVLSFVPFFKFLISLTSVGSSAKRSLISAVCSLLLSTPTLLPRSLLLSAHTELSAIRFPTERFSNHNVECFTLR